jgi:hypothetical protein
VNEVKLSYQPIKARNSHARVAWIVVGGLFLTGILAFAAVCLFMYWLIKEGQKTF